MAWKAPYSLAVTATNNLKYANNRYNKVGFGEIMFRNVITFLILFTLGSAAIWYGVPLAKGHISESDSISDLFANLQQTIYSPNDDTGDTGPEDNLDLSDNVSAVDNSKPEETTTPPPPTYNTKAVTRSPENRPTSYEAPEWGVIVREAPCYNSDGKLLKQHPGGTVVYIHSWKSTRSGELAECSLSRHGGISDPRFLMKQNDLDPQPYPMSQANRDSMKKLARYHYLSGAIELREKDLAEQAISANPHRNSYKRALKKYNSFAQKAAELTKKRDAATGSARSRYSDQLRSMISEYRRVEGDYKRTKTDYDNWKKSKASGAEYDGKIQSMRKEMKKIDKELRDYAKRCIELTPFPYGIPADSAPVYSAQNIQNADTLYSTLPRNSHQAGTIKGQKNG